MDKRALGGEKKQYKWKRKGQEKLKGTKNETMQVSGCEQGKVFTFKIQNKYGVRITPYNEKQQISHMFSDWQKTKGMKMQAQQIICGKTNKSSCTSKTVHKLVQRGYYRANMAHENNRK